MMRYKQRLLTESRTVQCEVASRPHTNMFEAIRPRLGHVYKHAHPEIVLSTQSGSVIPCLWYHGYS